MMIVFMFVFMFVSLFVSLAPIKRKKEISDFFFFITFFLNPTYMHGGGVGSFLGQ